MAKVILIGICLFHIAFMYISNGETGILNQNQIIAVLGILAICAALEKVGDKE